MATGCPADNALYKDDHHPFISVKSVSGFTAKDRTAMLRLTATQYPQATTHRLRLVNIKTCDVTQPPEDVESADVKVGEQVRVDIPKGTRWVAVYLLSPGLQDQWKLTFNHLT